MRGSIPALFLLLVFICAALKKTFEQRKTKKGKYVFLFLLTMLIYGSITPLSEIYRTVYITRIGWAHNVYKFRESVDFWNNSKNINPNFMGFVEDSSYGKFFMPAKQFMEVK
jgi:hypothetical protein